MGFVFCPTDGQPPRLIRFIEYLGKGLIALLDDEWNVLHVDKTFYDKLSDIDKQRVLTTRQDIESVWVDGSLRIDPDPRNPFRASEA
jgi:hypothetical protein